MFTAFVLALFTSADSPDLLPIGTFPDNQTCAFALNHLYFDGVCAMVIPEGEPVSLAPETSQRPRRRPEGL